jgi:hypothetical protein
MIRLGKFIDGRDHAHSQVRKEHRRQNHAQVIYDYGLHRLLRTYQVLVESYFPRFVVIFRINDQQGVERMLVTGGHRSNPRY